MPIPNIQQEELIVIDNNLRLRAYDDQFELALDWYQDSDMIYMIDGRGEGCMNILLGKVKCILLKYWSRSVGWLLGM